MLNRKQLIAMWLGILLTGFFWVGSCSFPQGSNSERIDAHYAQMFGVITFALVLSMASKRKEPEE